jgi:hypothetical protein
MIPALKIEIDEKKPLSHRTTLAVSILLTLSYFPHTFTVLAFAPLG